MKFRKYIIISVLVSTVYSQGNLGQSGGNFLQIDADAKGSALGGAVTAYTSGPTSTYWNPAGILSDRKLEFSFSHTSWFVDTKLSFAALTYQLGQLGAIGMSTIVFGGEDMEITTVYEPDGTGEKFAANDLSIGLSYARSLTNRFSFGLTGKYVSETIWNEKASQAAFDIGSIYQTDFYKLKLGMVIRNFAGKLEFDGEDIDNRIEEEEAREQENNPRIERLTPSFRLPQEFQLGIAFEPFTFNNSKLIVLADANIPSDNEERVIVGLEYSINDLIFLRGAYKINYDTDRFTFGIGGNIKVSNYLTSINYSYAIHDYLGNVHRFGIDFSM
jgi:hypothetical protein